MRKINRILLSAVMASMMPLTCLAVRADRDEDAAFEEFMSSEFKEAMESDYLTLHYTVKDYSGMDIDKPELIAGEQSWESYEEASQEAADTIKELKSFDRSKLSEENQINYDVYLFYLERYKELNDMPLFDFAFEPNGILDNLTVNFTEFVFYREEDINDYLEVLSTVDDYVYECLEVTQRQASEGYFLCDQALDETLDSIDKFVAKKEDNELIIIFNKNMDAMESISDADRQEYKDRNREIVLNEYIPAYEKVGEELEKLRGSRKGGDAVYDLPGGKEYYESLLKLKTSTDATAQEIFDLGDQYLQSMMTDYFIAAYAGKGDFNETRPEEDAESVLHYLQDHLDDFPEGPKVNFVASYLDPSVASPSTVAYYMTPPIDDVTSNVIRINGDLVGDTNELFTTLAHEGFPGHCYQITWFFDKGPHPLRSVVSNQGYTEGWAMYVQDYAWRLSGLSEASADLQRMDQNVNYLLNALCDIAVNGLGYDKDELTEYMGSLGLDAGFSDSMYDFVVANPAMITPYGIGLLQFLRLKDLAQNSLGDDFNLKDFHEVLLSGGDRPFNLVEADVRKYIENNGAVPQENKQDNIPPLPIVDPGTPSDSSNSAVPIICAVVCLLGIIGAWLWRRHIRRKNVFGDEA